MTQAELSEFIKTHTEVEVLALNLSEADLLACLVEYPFVFKNIPRQLVTQTLADQAVQGSASNFKHCPPHFMTQELADLAIHRSVMNIQHIPEHLVNKQMALTVVKGNFAMLDKIPKGYRSQEVIDIALRHSATAFFSLDHDEQTLEMAKRVARQTTLKLMVEITRPDLLTDQVLGLCFRIRYQDYDLDPKTVMRGLAYAFKHGITKSEIKDRSVPGLLRICSRLHAKERNYYEALLYLSVHSPEEIAKHVHDDAAAHAFRKIYGTDLALNSVRTHGRARKWLEDELGL